MKQKLSLLFALMLSTLMARAYDAKVDGIYYNLIPKGKVAEVTSGDTKYTGSVAIPESFTYDGVTYSVTSIGNYAFNNCSGLTSVTIGNSVTSIGNYAFNNCSGLTSITIPNSVTSIGDAAFYKCSGLTSVTIGNGVTSIGSYVFYNCSGLTSVTIPSSVTSIGGGAFSGCSGLTSVHIIDIVAWCKIKFNDLGSNPSLCAKHIFMNGKEITDLVIPNSVTSIGNSAFPGCSSLNSITIPNSVTSIGEYVFYGCSGLTSVTIPNSVTSIGDYAFQSCSGLTSVTIPNSVTRIGNYAFSGCSGLTSVTIPNSVTSIGAGAFYNCFGLTSITIPNSVTSIGSFAFYSCPRLTSVNITDIAAWCKISFLDSPSNPLYNAKHLILDGKEITDLVIPNSVTNIGNYAFYNCSGLTSVTIPNSVTSIGESAFGGCSGLTEITIGNGMTSIGENAFANCSELTDVYCYAEKVPSTNSDAFKDSYVNYATLYVPDASVAAYKAASPWSGFGTIKTLSGEIPETPKCATPTITISNGKLHFACETDDVEYVCKITPPSAITYNGNDINVPTKYTIIVYATKSGYENSDVATKEIDLCTSGLRGDVNNDGKVSMPDAMFIVNKILNDKFPDEETLKIEN